jgi:hypothetical protein
MRRTFWLVLGFAAWSMSAAPLSVVEGRVTKDQQPLPGCTVRLGAGESQRADAEGRYAFRGVAEGEYEIFFELEELKPEEQRVLVQGERVEVPVQELRVSELPETIVLGCSRPPCSDDGPMDRYDLPRCSDYELHDSLFESAGRGDASSIRLLRDRYATAETLSERNRLGGMLGRITGDSAIWNELAGLAEIAVRFPDAAKNPSPAYERWCAEQGIADPLSHWYLARDALGVASADRRSRPLLARVLATGEPMLLYYVMDRLAQQHALDALPLIEKALDRLPEDERSGVAHLLVHFRDERADALAQKYFEDEDDAETYRDQARSLAETEPR